MSIPKSDRPTPDQTAQCRDFINAAYAPEPKPMVTDEVVERVARAMHKHETSKLGITWEQECEFSPETRKYWLDAARVAIDAMQPTGK